MDTKFTMSMVPSKASEFLRRFTGKKVARLVRYSWWPAEEVGTQCGIRDEQAFSLTAGPLVVHFEDGAILGLASDSSLNSVIVWDETARRAGHGSSSLDTDDELFAISESGPFAGGCWRQFVGLSLNGFTILRRATVSSKEGSVLVRLDCALNSTAEQALSRHMDCMTTLTIFRCWRSLNCLRSH